MRMLAERLSVPICRSVHIIDLLERFITLWVVIDPIGTVPVFVAVTATMQANARRSTALYATAVGIGVLVFFLVFGQILIDALGISLLSFQVAGGIILFMFALSMIFGEPKATSDLNSADPSSADSGAGPSVAIFPLAVPSLASPGAMLAIVMMTDNNHFAIPDQIVTAAVMSVVMACACALMLLAGPIIRIIGYAGAAIVSRVMGMILASVAVDAVLSALLEIAASGTL